MTSRHALKARAGTRARRAGHAIAISALVGGGVVLGGCSSSGPSQANASSSTTAPPTTAADASTNVQSGEMQAGFADVVPIVLQRDDKTGVTGTVTGKPGWPRYSPSVIVIPSGKQVTLVIDNYDDMTTPLTSALASYDNVQGGTETVNGQTVSSVTNTQIAHTFTVPDLGINVPVPVATDQGSGTAKIVAPAVVTFTFTPAKSGTFTWHCYTPCGTGSSGTGGPMATAGWMEGTLRVAT